MQVAQSSKKQEKSPKKQKIKKFMPHKGVDVDVKHNPTVLEKFQRIVEEKGSYLCSIKHDGWRGVFKDGEIYTSSMRPCPNQNVHKQYAWLKKLTKDLNIILDCEFDDPNLSFSEISSIMKSSKKELGNLKPYFFDLIYNENFDLGYSSRMVNLRGFAQKRGLDVVEHKICTSYDEIITYFEESLSKELEGIMIRHIDSSYKFRRSTLKSGDLFKMKDIVTYDAKVLDIKFFKHRKVNPGDPILFEEKYKMAGEILGLWMNSKGEEVEVKVACSTMKDAERAQVWKDREKYIGQWVEFKALFKGQKDLPRHPRYFRFRNDLEKSIWYIIWHALEISRAFLLYKQWSYFCVL